MKSVEFPKDESRQLEIISLNKQAWENVADKYSKKDYDKVTKLVKFFSDLLPAKSKVLDVGSGTGLPFAKFLVEKGFQVLGIDISAKMIEIAQKNVPQATFKQLSMTEIEYVNEFDGIFASYSMLLLNPRLFEDVAKRVVRALKKDRWFYISLNESNEGDADDWITEIMGEKMYSRGYTKKEVLETFISLGMELLKFDRKTVHSKEFGEEHMIEFVFRKL